MRRAILVLLVRHQFVDSETLRRRDSTRFLALDDFDRAARRHLPRMLYGFIEGAAETNASEQANKDSSGEHALVTRVLTDTSARSQVTKLFGTRHAAPFGIAPMGAAALCAYRGDLALAQGAVEADIPMMLSASSLIPRHHSRRIRSADADLGDGPGVPGIAAPICRCRRLQHDAGGQGRRREDHGGSTAGDGRPRRRRLRWTRVGGVRRDFGANPGFCRCHRRDHHGARPSQPGRHGTGRKTGQSDPVDLPHR